MTVRADFSGQRVWVTGAASGIGQAIAGAFAAAGALVTALDINPADSLPGCFQQRLDVTDAQQVAITCERLLAEQGGVDVLVNAAGVLRVGTLDRLTAADWHKCMAVNAAGVFHLLSTLTPVFRTQRRGAVVTVASNAAHVPRMGMAAYCASKAAVRSLTQCAGLELAPYGVRCNLVSPGSTDTPMLHGMFADADIRQRSISTLIAGLPEQYKAGIPLQKIATPQDIANAVLFLASDMASHITMQDIVVDGGATLAA